MVFTEPEFLFFFLPLLLGIVCALEMLSAYGLSKSLSLSLQNQVTLVFSLLFYAYGETVYSFVIVVSILANYSFGLAIERKQDSPAVRYIVATGIAFNIGLLVFFKYQEFLTANCNVILNLCSIPEIAPWDVHLPLGISFFTFQAMSYTVDVYRKDTVAQRSLSRLALYIALFPQLIAGPIVRYRDIARQLTDRVSSSELFASGVRRFILGLGKKVIIANTMAVPADTFFDAPADELTFFTAWMSTVCYSLQIYFDFSGYSDMAIGLGRMLGFRLRENFNYPYVATSVTEFWRRWHISLSTWFRDYLYIPLGGNRRGPWRTYRNLVIVFLLCGLWHGASWNFILWGLFHGSFLIAERMGLSSVLVRRRASLRHTYLLLVVSVGWCVFRAESLGQLAGFLYAMCGLNGWVSSASNALFYETPFQLTFLVGLAFATPLIERIRKLKNWCLVDGLRLRQVTWGVAELAGLMLIGLYSVMLIAADTYNPFIYFRF